MRPCWLAFAGKMGGKITRRAQGKSALAALVGKRQRLLEAPFSRRSIIACRIRGGKAPLEAKALDLIPIVATSAR